MRPEATVAATLAMSDEMARLQAAGDVTLLAMATLPLYLHLRTAAQVKCKWQPFQEWAADVRTSLVRWEQALAEEGPGGRADSEQLSTCAEEMAAANKRWLALLVRLDADLARVPKEAAARKQELLRQADNATTRASETAQSRASATQSRVLSGFGGSVGLACVAFVIGFFKGCVSSGETAFGTGGSWFVMTAVIGAVIAVGYAIVNHQSPADAHAEGAGIAENARQQAEDAARRANNEVQVLAAAKSELGRL